MGESKSNTGFKALDDSVDNFVGNVNSEGKKLEKDLGKSGKEAALLMQGKWNNALSISGEGSVDRYEREAKEKVASAELADQQAVAAEAERELQAQITGIVTAQGRTPGRAQTLIGGKKTAANTLLTLKGSS